MELFFLLLLVVIMATALGSGYPVAFALPGAAIITIGLAAATGYLFESNVDAYFHSGGGAEPPICFFSFSPRSDCFNSGSMRSYSAGL